MLFTDQYRPEVDISRSEIRKITLEMVCDVMLIRDKLGREGYWTRIHTEELLKNEPWMIPTSVYYDLVQKRPDLEDQLMIPTQEEGYGWNDIKKQVAQKKTLILRWNFSYAFNRLEKQLSLACLKYHYDLRMSMSEEWDEIYIREKTAEQLELHSDIFPPSLFVYPDEECRYLTRDLSENRHFCNASHRLSKFMLQNADLLQEKVPGILKEMIRILQEESGEQLISGINNLLNRLRSLPNQPIQVPSDLYLTIEDLCQTKRIYEA